MQTMMFAIRDFREHGQSKLQKGQDGKKWWLASELGEASEVFIQRHNIYSHYQNLESPEITKRFYQPSFIPWILPHT